MELQIADDIKDTFQVEFTPVLADARLDCITFPSGMTSALEDFKQELKGQADIVIVDRFPGAGCNSIWVCFQQAVCIFLNLEMECLVRKGTMP